MPNSFFESSVAGMYVIFPNTLARSEDMIFTDKSRKTAFSTLKLKLAKNYVEFTYEDRTIQVIQYLPVIDKLDLIEIAYQKSIVNSTFNPLLFNVHFWLNVVYSYTNITFTDEQRKDESKIFDLLVSSNLLEKIIAAMDNNEFNYYRENVDSYIETRLRLDYSAGGIANKATSAINKFSDVISEKLSALDESAIQKILDAFPQLVNGENKIV